MWTWRSTLSKIKINTAVCTSFVLVCTDHYFVVPQTVKQKVKNKKWPARNFKIFKFHLCHSKENLLYPFVPLLFSFISQRVRRYSAFQFLRNPYIANLANFKDRNGTNGIRKRIVCIRLYLYYFRLYLKGFGDTAISKFHKCAKRGSRPFLKISLLLLFVSHSF